MVTYFAQICTDHLSSELGQKRQIINEKEEKRNTREFTTGIVAHTFLTSMRFVRHVISVDEIPVQ